jgi:acyl-coenzyme A thioesterase PaaI-like protein
MPERQPSSRSCFVCGRDNEGGLRTRWVSDRAAGEVRSTVTVAERFHGYPGVVHGGVLTALMDEAMVRSLLIDGGFDDLQVTGRMDVSFRLATPTGVPIVVAGRLLQRSASRSKARAEVRLSDGTVTAHAEALLVRPTPEVAEAWARERPYWSIDEE